jgi:hypothetical protein
VKSIGSRLKRLEDRGRCSECDLTPDGPGRIAVITRSAPIRASTATPTRGAIVAAGPSTT